MNIRCAGRSFRQTVIDQGGELHTTCTARRVRIVWTFPSLMHPCMHTQAGAIDSTFVSADAMQTMGANTVASLWHWSPVLIWVRDDEEVTWIYIIYIVYGHRGRELLPRQKPGRTQDRYMGRAGFAGDGGPIVDICTCSGWHGGPTLGCW
jgi:hypothetical protein